LASVRVDSSRRALVGRAAALVALLASAGAVLLWAVGPRRGVDGLSAPHTPTMLGDDRPGTGEREHPHGSPDASGERSRPPQLAAIPPREAQPIRLAPGHTTEDLVRAIAKRLDERGLAARDGAQRPGIVFGRDNALELLSGVTPAALTALLSDEAQPVDLRVALVAIVGTRGSADDGALLRAVLAESPRSELRVAAARGLVMTVDGNVAVSKASVSPESHAALRSALEFEAEPEAVIRIGASLHAASGEAGSADVVRAAAATLEHRARTDQRERVREGLLHYAVDLSAEPIRLILDIVTTESAEPVVRAALKALASRLSDSARLDVSAAEVTRVLEDQSRSAHPGETADLLDAALALARRR